MQGQDKNRGKLGNKVRGKEVQINTETRNLKKYRARVLNQEDIKFLNQERA